MNEKPIKLTKDQQDALQHAILFYQSNFKGSSYAEAAKSAYDEILKYIDQLNKEDEFDKTDKMEFWEQEIKIDKSLSSDKDPSLKCEICEKGKEAGFINYQEYIDGYAHSTCAWEMEDFDGWASHEFGT